MPSLIPNSHSSSTQAGATATCMFLAVSIYFFILGYLGVNVRVLQPWTGEYLSSVRLPTLTAERTFHKYYVPLVRSRDIMSRTSWWSYAEPPSGSHAGPGLPTANNTPDSVLLHICSLALASLPHLSLIRMSCYNALAHPLIWRGFTPFSAFYLEVFSQFCCMSASVH